MHFLLRCDKIVNILHRGSGTRESVRGSDHNRILLICRKRLM